MPGRRRKPGSPHGEQLPSGRHGLSRDFVVENQRERVVKALVATIDAYGYGGCSVERVATRAGVSRRTFYELFDGREDAYLRTYDETAECLLQRVADASAKAGDGPGKLRLYLETILESIAGNPQLARAYMVEVLAAGPTALEHRERHMHSFATLLEAAAVEHNGAPPPPFTTDGLVAAIYDVIYKHVSRERTEELPQLLEDLYSFCLMLFHYAQTTQPDPR